MHKYTKEIRAVKMIERNNSTKEDEEKLKGEIKVLKEMVKSKITV